CVSYPIDLPAIEQGMLLYCLVDVPAGGDEFGQLGGKCGVTHLPGRQVHSVPAPEGVEQVGEHPVESALTASRLVMSVGHHVQDPRFSASNTRKFFNPRKTSPATASRLRPRRRPTSASDRPCRWCNSTAWRWSPVSRSSPSANRASCSPWMAFRPGVDS